MELATAFVGVELKDTAGLVSEAAAAGKKAGQAAGQAIEEGVDRGTQEAAGKAKKNIGNVGNDIRNAFQVGGTLLALKGLIGAASDLNEEVSKSQVIFGDAAPAIANFAKGAEAIGQSERQALQAAGTFAVFGKAAGLAGDDLSNFAVKSDQLASDLASFFNTSPEQAIQAIGAAFRGESEPIRAYGVLLNDASLKQEALDEGLIKSTSGTLPQAARVQAAYGLIMKQTTDAQGDFARTADGVANSSRVLAAQFENTKASLGNSLLPVFKDVLKVAGVMLTAFDSLPGPIKTATVALLAMAALRGPMLALGESIGAIATSTLLTNPALIAAVGIVGAAAIVFADLGSGVDETSSKYSGFNKAVLDTTKTVAAQNDELINSALNNDKTGAAMVRLGLTGDTLKKVLGGTRDEVLNYGQALSQAAGDSEDAQDAIKEIQTRLAAIQWAQYTAAALQFNGAVKTLGEEGIVQAARTAGSSADSIQRLSDAFANGTTTATAISLTGINVVATMEEVRKQMELASKATEGVSQANADLTNANDDVSTSLQGITDAYDSASTAAGRFKSALDNLVNSHLDEQAAADATIKASAAIQDALKKNGATLDENTEKGRDNRESIRASIEAEEKYVDAFIKGGGSIDDASLKLEQYRQGLVDQAMQFGLTHDEAEAYVAQLGLTPESITTSVELTHLEAEQERLSTWLKGLDGVPKEKQTEIQALIDAGKINEAEQELNNLARNRTVTFGVRVVGGQAVDTVQGTVNGRVISGERAHGGPVAAGRLYRVNEYSSTRGPEFFVPNSDGRIVPLGQALDRSQAEVGGQVIYAGITVTGTVVDMGDLDRWADERDRKLAAILGQR